MPKDSPKKPAPKAFLIQKGEEGIDAITSMERELTRITSGQERRQKQTIESQAAPPEDFRGQLSPAGDDGVIEPPIAFDVLEELVQTNNILPPLVAAMKANIDGTGAEIEPREPVEVEDEQEKANEDPDNVTAEMQETRQKDIQDFFDEPWPEESFLTQRLKIREDVEKVGNAYLEIVRNPEGQLIGTRPIDGKNIRIVRLDDPVEVVKRLKRFGSEVDFKFRIRERRYFQKVNRKKVWFKEFGASRDLDKLTGKWAEKGEKLPDDDRANELIHFTGERDIFTPYGLPRWWANAPSVVGSRKAEEFNLDFFDAGGIPPLMLIVQGGKLAENAEQMLRDHFTASGPSRHQAAVLEAYGGGSVDEADRVKVTVERFGSERQADSMFENYIEQCDKRVRRAFRLPSIFLGMSDDISFATAFASYTVAEAQVFAPERMEFDEVINLKIMPELPHGEEFVYRSIPLSAVDVTSKLAGMELAKDIAGKKSLLDSVNETLNLALEPPDEDELSQKAEEAEAEQQREMERRFGPGGPPDPNAPPGTAPARVGAPAEQGGGNGTPTQVQRSEVLTGLGMMAVDAAEGLLSGDLSNVVQSIASLRPHERETVSKLLSAELFESLSEDPEGAAELAAGCLALAIRGAPADGS